MSLVVVVYVPGGIVMAGDSRTMGTIKLQQRKKASEQFNILSDNSYKVVMLTRAPAGVAHTGTAVINNQPVETHIRRFEEEKVREGTSIPEVAQALSAHFEENFAGIPVQFCVAGYETVSGASVPHVYSFHTTAQPKPNRVNAKDGEIRYGILRSGDTEIVNRLIRREFLPPFQALPVQDAIDYAIYLIDLTIKTMSFEPRVPTVGGPIDVLLMTPDGVGFVQQKQLHGQDPSQVWQPRPAGPRPPTQGETSTEDK
jgi:hypothetical protein